MSIYVILAIAVVVLSAGAIAARLPVLIFGIVLAAFVIAVIALTANDYGRLHAARNEAQHLCGSLGAVTYDVQDQDELVYACNSDHILRTLGY